MSIQLSRWLEEGVFGAIDDGFLESLTFAIYVKDPLTGKEITIENYTFTISQTTLPNGDDVATFNQVPLISRESMKSQAKHYIRQLSQFAATLDDLPSDRYVTMQLCYKEDTPHSYEPLHFNGSFIDKFVVGDDGKKVITSKIGEIKSNAACMKVEFNGIEDLSQYNFQAPAIQLINPKITIKDKVSFSSIKNLIIKNGRVTLSECSKVLSISPDLVIEAMDHMMKDGLVKSEAGYYCLNSTPAPSQNVGKNILDDVTPAQESIEDFEESQHQKEEKSKKRGIEKVENANNGKGPKKNKNQAAGQLVLETKVKKTAPTKQKAAKPEKVSVTREPIVLKRTFNDGNIPNETMSQSSEI
jgi:hypothetical protein